MNYLDQLKKQKDKIKVENSENIFLEFELENHFLVEGTQIIIKDIEIFLKKINLSEKEGVRYITQYLGKRPKKESKNYVIKNIEADAERIKYIQAFLKKEVLCPKCFHKDRQVRGNEIVCISCLHFFKKF